MKYLITGGNGFVGTFLKDSLLKNGHKVKTLGKSSANDFQVDLTISTTIISEDFDVIIHSASIVHNSSHAGSINQQLIINDLEITFNFLKSIEAINFQKVIFLSSVSVYGIEDGTDIGIFQPLSPKSGYGLSKTISEKLFQQKFTHEKLLILRLPLINGPNPKGNIKKALNAINSGKMFLFKGNKAIKSVIELDDLHTFIVSKSLKFYGIHQIKSYDVKFNDFIEGLSSKRIYFLPYFSFKLLTLFSKTFRLRKLHNSLIKISKDLTFIDTTK